MDTDLPHDLIQAGYKLYRSRNDGWWAVSNDNGCTQTLATVAAVVTQARRMIWLRNRYRTWQAQERQQAAEREAYRASLTKDQLAEEERIRAGQRSTPKEEQVAE